MLTDSHAHLTFSRFDADREDIIKKAREEGLEYILTVGEGLEDSLAALELARRYDFIYASAGIHPHNASESDPESLRELESLCDEDKIIAVGETGLDYYYDHSPRDVQRKVFREQIKIAQRKRLPLIIHSRDALEDTLRILEETRAGRNGGVIHCFTYDAEAAGRFVDLGFMISFTGILTFPKSKELRKAAASLPYEKIMIETDCPFLAPAPVRGKRNLPHYVKYVARELSKILPLSYEDVCRVTTSNFERLYGLEEGGAGNVIAYPIRNALYLNITNRCTNSCCFCVRNFADGVSGYRLWISVEPSAEELIEAIGDPGEYDEIIFCGFGEPTVRLDVLKAAAGSVKEKGGTIRVNTNGHGNIIHGRNILPELEGLVDKMAVSLNAHDGESYKKICRPRFENIDVFSEVLEFIEEAKKHIPQVEITCVATPEANIDKCRDIARDLGVQFRLRNYNVVG